MAKREVTVVINGEEYVSKAADDAAEGMNRFTGKIGGWFKSFVDLKAAWDLAVKAAGFLKDQISASFDAFDQYRASLQKLEGAAKLTGTPLTTLKEIADTGREAFKLSAGVANDFAAEVAKLASKAGDTSKAKDALAAFLEIGAARGMSAAETLQAVKMAVLGVDEGTDRLFSKNPSVIYKDFADRIGVLAAKLTDQQKAQALLTEATDSGLKVQGTYAKYLETSAGKQEQMNNSIESARVSFGQALDPLRAFTLQLGAKLMPVLAPLATFIAQVLTLAFTGFGKVLNNVYGVVGLVAEGLGKVTGQKALEDWGARQVKSATEMGTALNELSDAARKLGQDVDSSVSKQRQLDEAFRASTTVASTYGTQTGAAHDKVKDASKGAADQLDADAKRINQLLTANLGPSLKDAIYLTEGALKSLGESAKVQLDPRQAEQFTRHMQSLVTEAGNVRTRLEAMPEPIKKGSDNSRDMAEKVASIARAGLDAAQAFGVMNDQAAATLNTVINLGVGIAKVAANTGDASGWAAIISSTAALLSKLIGGDPERRRLINANTEALRRLTDQVGTLNLSVTGEQFAKAQGALESVIGNLRGGRGAQNQADVLGALRRVGMSFGDLKKIADELGIQIVSSSGAMSVDGIKALLDAMKLMGGNLGRFGTDYASQLQATRASFDVNQLDARGQLSALFGLAGNFNPQVLLGALNMSDLAGSRKRLADIFKRFNEGGFSASELGSLSGTQFLDLVTELIQRIDDLAKEAAPAPSGDTSADVAGVGSVPTGSTAQTVSEAVKEQTEAVSTLLTEHTALHTRIAKATERTADAAEAILAAMREAVGGGLSDNLDMDLEARRRAYAAQRGFQLSF